MEMQNENISYIWSRIMWGKFILTNNQKNVLKKIFLPLLMGKDELNPLINI